MLQLTPQSRIFVATKPSISAKASMGSPRSAAARSATILSAVRSTSSGTARAPP